MTRSLLSLLACLAGVLFSLAPIAGHAGVVDAQLPSGKMASASYQAGNKDQPAVLVLHGFLQTRAFPTVTSIVEAVSTAGYTTLAPTLTLGISRRIKVCLARRYTCIRWTKMWLRLHPGCAGL